MRVTATYLLFVLAATGCGRSSPLPLPLHDAGVSAPDTGPTSPKSCYRGVAFAQCPGPHKPAAYCAGFNEALPGSQGCLWVSNGKPLGQYKVKLAADCTCKQCEERHRQYMRLFLISFGTAPWTRTRELNATVKIDKTVTVGSKALSCNNCKGVTCQPASSPCNSSLGFVQRTLPGTFVVYFFSSVMMGGWYMMLEMDIKASPMRGRICHVPYTDAISCAPGLPVCATSGEVLISDAPTDSNHKGIAGWFKAKFPDGMSAMGAF